MEGAPFALVAARKDLSGRSDDLAWVPTISERDTTGGELPNVSAYGAVAGRKRYISVPGVAEFLWEVGSDVVEVAARPGAEADLVQDAIQGVGTPLFLQAAQGYEVLHASAVATVSGVLGFCGYSGDGKSTLAHAFTLRGTTLWADDLLAFRVSDEEATATALPFRPNLRAASRSFFGASPPGGQRTPDTVEPWSTDRVRALFVLDPKERSRSSSATFRLERLGGPDAIEALLPHGLRLLPLDKDRERQILIAYLNLVALIPLFRIEYTRSFSVLPRLLAGVERRLAAESG